MRVRTKRLFLYALSFFVGVFFDGYIFSVYFSRILVGKLTWILNNTLLSILLFGWLFIFFPAIFAYYIAFKSYHPKDGDVPESDPASNSYRNKVTIGITVLLGVLVFLLIRFLTQPNFAPYTLQGVDESEFISPTPTPTPIPGTEAGSKILAKKRINGLEYALIETKDGTGVIYLYRDYKKIWDKPLPMNTSPWTPHFWFDESSNILFTVERRGYYDRGYELITSYRFDANKFSMEIWAVKEATLPYQTTEILRYYASNNSLLMYIGGGDGCGGGGEIWILFKGSSTVIQKFGAGCSLPELPRYIGFTGLDLVFSSNTAYVDTASPPSTIEKIYLLNPITRQVTNLLSKENMPETIRTVKLSEEDPNILKLYTVSANYKDYIGYNISQRAILDKVEGKE